MRMIYYALLQGLVRNLCNTLPAVGMAGREKLCRLSGVSLQLVYRKKHAQTRAIMDEAVLLPLP